MKAIEKLKLEHPEHVGSHFEGGADMCPSTWGYIPRALCKDYCLGEGCTACWQQDIPEESGESEEIVDALCEVGNVNVVTAEEIKAATIKKKFTLILTEKEHGDSTISTENDGFNALEILGFLEMKQQDILEQLRHPTKFVRKFANGDVKEEATDE